ncbi:MAG: hypothetical protein J1F43_06610 [Muribaculaceae bacterium]|nr:hypothetical protein [Muribaculaceae bacterium]
MKSLIKFFTFIAFCSLAMVSCGGADMKAINEKIEKEGVEATFSNKEYAAMADYILSHFDDVDQDEKIFDYTMILLAADVEGKLDNSTKAKCEEIQKKAQQTVRDNFNY